MKLSAITLAAIFYGVSALQFCEIDAENLTNLCVAVASGVNASTGESDLSIHLSVDFVDRNGWAAVGLGEEMNGALMFVMFPGAEVGEVTVSIRTIDRWAPPLELSDSNSIYKVSNAISTPSISVVGTWFDFVTGLHHAQIMCYDCESWSTSDVSLLSISQPWIWASGPYQKTRSTNSQLALTIHHAKGVKYLNMASAFEESSSLILAQVSDTRVSSAENVSDSPIEPSTDNSEHESESEPEVKPDTQSEVQPEPATKSKPHHPHKLLGVVSLHGIVLASSFFILSIGTLAIRSGFAKSFKLHWVIQAVGGTGIVIGCLMGIWLSYAHGSHFKSFHQWIGILIVPTIVLQALFGYWHHVNFVRYNSSTAVSGYHVWIGRVLLVAGNVNVCFGLNMTHPFVIERLVYYAVILAQALALLPMWYFWAREGKTLADVVRGQQPKSMGLDRNVQYKSIEGEEGDAFIVGGVGDEYELEEEELGLRKREESEESEDEVEYRNEKQ